jgi:hypothetical protein
MGYALALWAIFIPGYRIFRVKRLEYRRDADEAMSRPAASPFGRFS